MSDRFKQRLLELQQAAEACPTRECAAALLAEFAVMQELVEATRP